MYTVSINSLAPHLGCDEVKVLCYDLRRLDPVPVHSNREYKWSEYAAYKPGAPPYNRVMPSLTYFVSDESFMILKLKHGYTLHQNTTVHKI